MAIDPSRSSLQGVLDPDTMLIAEFQYIAQTAFQANEDRARVSNYYYLTAAAAVAAIVGAKLEGAVPAEAYWGFSLLFGVLSGIGVLTLLQLARLRSAWTESARAMNVIKDYYIKRCPDAGLETAFAWRTETIPSPDKRGTVAFLLAMSVALIDMATAAAMVVYAAFAVNNGQSMPAALIVAGFVAVAFSVAQYRAYVSVARGQPTATISGQVGP